MVKFFFSTPSWFNEFYTRPYNRAAPYIWGILFGYVMHHLPHKYHRKQGTKLPHVSPLYYVN